MFISTFIKVLFNIGHILDRALKITGTERRVSLSLTEITQCTAEEIILCVTNCKNSPDMTTLKHECQGVSLL